MKIRELQKVTNDKIGKVIRNDVYTEPHEDSTILYLTQFGFDIELIKPTNIEKSDNPDIMMLGTIWEIKRPESSNEKTIKKKFHKASLQADNVIFDLRDTGKNARKVENWLMKMFSKGGRVRHMIIILGAEKALDIIK